MFTSKLLKKYTLLFELTIKANSSKFKFKTLTIKAMLDSSTLVAMNEIIIIKIEKKEISSLQS